MENLGQRLKFFEYILTDSIVCRIQEWTMPCCPTMWIFMAIHIPELMLMDGKLKMLLRLLERLVQLIMHFFSTVLNFSLRYVNSKWLHSLEQIQGKLCSLVELLNQTTLLWREWQDFTKPARNISLPHKLWVLISCLIEQICLHFLFDRSTSVSSTLAVLWRLKDLMLHICQWSKTESLIWRWMSLWISKQRKIVFCHKDHQLPLFDSCHV
jgi:hypothetical protein